MLTDRLAVDKFGIARFVSDAATLVIRAPHSSSMNLRRPFFPVFAAALAVACSPSRPDDSQHGIALASMGGGSLRSTNAVEKSVKSTSQTLATKFDVTLDGSDVRFSLKVVNTTPKSVEVNFASGQAYDFVVVDSLGREVWRWSADRIFTQSVRNKLLGRGEAITASEKWSPAKPGRFMAIAHLTSSNFPVEEKVSFERK